MFLLIKTHIYLIQTNSKLPFEFQLKKSEMPGYRKNSDENSKN